jgi:hypothetical protein
LLHVLIPTAVLLGLCGLLAFHGPADWREIASASEPPDSAVYLPLACASWRPQVCPASSTNAYESGTAYQVDQDDPVRPAVEHADKNLALRGYAPNSDSVLKRELVAYDTRAPIQPPQLATLFSPIGVPELAQFYRVHHWQWAPSPEPGTRSDPITAPVVTALGLATNPGEELYVPESGHSLGAGFEVIVLFADEDSLALRYTRDDSSAPSGYTLHIDGLCTDPSLLAVYAALDDPDGPRYEYPNAAYDLPILRAGQPIGTARGGELVIAITDSGTFQDPRSCEDWWQVRPGYPGSCPPHD